MSCSRRALRALAALAFAFALALALAAPAAAGSKRADDDDLDTRVEATLARHLDGPRIGAWLETLPAGSLEDQAARWILAWLPLSDCAALDLPLLREHVEIAAATYRDSPWREQLPRELWLRFVVPHRVSQEPAQAWRASFATALAPRIAGAASMEIAALAVNRWCREQATYTPSSGRDLGPLSTIARGLGRCEEETILTVCALRAAGLPARSCATPYWTFTDSNHAWVEVWTDGAWHYLGGCEPERCLDRAWFTGAARRAGFVRSAAYGEFDPAPEPLYRREQGVTLINSTPVYGTPIRLRAALDPALAVPTPRELTVNVLNFGSLRPLAKVPDGGEIAIGPGEYALTAGDDSTLYLRVVGGAGGERLAVTLGEADRYDLDAAAGFWLRYPEDEAPPARDLDLVSDAEDAALARGIAAREADRAKLREASPAERARLDSLPAAQAKRYLAVLDTKPHTRASLFVALLDAAADSLAREDLLAVLEAMDDKDLLELDETAIAGELALAQAQHGRLATLGLAVPDSIWRSGALPNRIDREAGSAWRAGLPLLPLGDDAQSSLDALLAAFHARVQPVAAGYHGSPLDPAQCWALGLGTEEDLGVCLVGLLRRNGWPARLRYGVCEVWLEGWRALDPKAAALRAPAGEAGPGLGRLALTVTRDGLPDSLAESYRHFNVARLAAGACQSPWWEPVLGEQDWDAGAFIFSTANRVPDGSIYGRLRRFHVLPGALTRMSLPLDIGPGWESSAVFFSGPAPQRVLDPLLMMTDHSGLGTDPEAPWVGAATVQDAASCLIVFYEAGEPAVRMLTALRRVRDRILARNAYILLVAKGDGLPFKQLDELGFGPADGGKRGKIHKRVFPEWALKQIQPETAEVWDAVPIVLLKLDGEFRYCRSGFDPAVDQNLNLVLDLVPSAPGAP
jgi:hypothetical protein